ncbi:MAG TPA: oligosaccharide flippase family protein [Firmicutes bacterium]|nr:oligosaccharide flippase family protein [Bacillota bacterium]
MNKKRMIINLFASLVSFGVSMGISFFLTPYLTEVLGTEAYGYIGLANNFVSYASIVTVALNSMAGRFITIEIHRGNQQKADEYFNSILLSNVFLSVVISLISLIIILNIQTLLKVSDRLVQDVQITFAVAFLNFVFTVVTAVFTVAPFARNRLDVQSIRTILGNLIKLIVTLGLIAFFTPKIYYISIGVLACSVFMAGADIFLTKKMLPEVKVNPRHFNFQAVKEVLSAGIWNSLNSLSYVLLMGLDLLLANLFVGETAMGMLSIAKTIPTALQSLIVAISGIFTPQFTILYAKKQGKELVSSVKYSIKVLSLIMTVPIAGLIIFGTDFYHLWLPGKTAAEIQTIQILSLMTLVPKLVSAYIDSLYAINTVTNHLKVPVLVNLGLGVANTVLVLILLKTTSLGVYGIAIANAIMLFLKVVFFVPSYAASNLGQKLTIFYPAFFRAVISSVLIMVLFAFLGNFFVIDSWLDLILVALGCGVVGYLFNILILLTRQERKEFFAKIKNKLHPSSS